MCSTEDCPGVAPFAVRENRAACGHTRRAAVGKKLICRVPPNVSFQSAAHSKEEEKMFLFFFLFIGGGGGYVLPS